MSQDHATVAEEEYLQIIYWLQEAGLPMTGANIARAMQVSAPTVHEMIGRLERDGYITRAGDKTISFTKNGAEHAEGIVRRHRLIERFLTDVFDIPWDQVHEEAERLEHWMSPMVEERMLRAIGDAKTCPHGHPIFEGEREHGVPLADVEEGASVRVRITPPFWKTWWFRLMALAAIAAFVREAMQRAERRREALRREKEYLEQSVGEILRSMDKLSEGDLTVQLPVKNQDEIGLLCQGFNKVVVDIHDHLLKEVEKVVQREREMV